MAAIIALTRGKHAIIDDADLPLVQGYSWHSFPMGNTWYAATTVRGRRVYLHRLILNAAPGVHVDHINGDGLDCRRTNLRPASQYQNVRNARLQARSKSGFKGVTKHSARNKWVAGIRFQGRTIYLGIFQDVADAARAYDAAARRLFGEFACLNFPLSGEQGCR